MSYVKQTWADFPSQATPITAARLTHLEDGIEQATTRRYATLAAAQAVTDYAAHQHVVIDDGTAYLTRAAGDWATANPIQLGTTSPPEVGDGNALPDPGTATVRLFVVENTADPVTEPDGLYARISNSWVRVTA